MLNLLPSSKADKPLNFRRDRAGDAYRRLQALLVFVDDDFLSRSTHQGATGVEEMWINGTRRPGGAAGDVVPQSEKAM